MSRPNLDFGGLTVHSRPVDWAQLEWGLLPPEPPRGKVKPGAGVGRGATSLRSSLFSPAPVSHSWEPW